MKRFFTKYGVALLAIAALAAVLLSVMSYFSTTAASLENVAGIIASPFRAAGAAVSETFDRLWGTFTEYDDLKEENRQLKLQIAEMEETVRQAQADRDENQRLRKLCELREQRRDLHMESAHIVERDTSSYASMFTVNKGTNEDVAVGDCVLTEEGYLVGVVVEAGSNWSTVRTILDSDSSIGATVFRSGQVAVAEGDFALMSQNRLKLDYLGAESELVAGDLIQTSGLGGFYPSQIVIGSVEEVRTADDGLSLFAIIRPQANIDRLTQVFIVTSFDIVD